MGCGSSSQVENTKGYSKADNPSMILKENHGDFKKDYQLREQVGEGTYGVVRRCRNRVTGEERVVKRILKSQMRKEEQQIKMANDIIFLRKIDHPNVIKPFEFYQDDDYFWVVTEYVSGGDLINRLEYKGLITEKEASNIVRQVLSVLVWCHKNGIMHRDLKPENIMLETSSQKDVGYQIKVIDWGTACQFNSGQKINELIGTPYYIAPEVVSKGSYYNEKCDIWSLGAMLYTILSGDPPFYADDIHLILQMVEEGTWTFDGDIWDSQQGGISEQAKDLIKKMMTKDPKQRISAEQALNHTWIQSAPDNQIGQDFQINYINKLHKFNSKNKLQQSALMFISQQCSQKTDRDRLAQAFRAIDKNQDGTLNKQEILAFLQETLTAEQAEQECKEMISRVDIDQNGLINYSEFLMATHEVQQSQLKQSLKQAFEYFDIDKNGYITTDELQKLIGTNMKDSDESLWNDILQQADRNNDKQISFEEFCQMMTTMAESAIKKDGKEEKQ